MCCRFYGEGRWITTHRNSSRLIACTARSGSGAVIRGPHDDPLALGRRLGRGDSRDHLVSRGDEMIADELTGLLVFAGILVLFLLCLWWVTAP
jgi:hypothetical protein